MKYEISVSETGDYVIARILDFMDRKMAETYMNDLQRACVENNLSRILIDVRTAINVMSTTSEYWFVHEAVKKSGLKQSNRLAMLTRPDDHSHDMVGTISQNAGYNMHLFRDENEAVAWLTTAD